MRLWIHRPEKDTHLASKRALQEAESAHERVQARGDEVHEVSQNLKKIRTENHFAERIQQIMEGGPKL